MNLKISPHIEPVVETGASVIARILKKHGIDRVFTFPGGTIAPVFEELGKVGIEIVCARHEQGAGYMALAIARLTRTPQVVMVTSGPGATNLATVVADAYFDSTPLIAITGQVGTVDLKSGRQVRQVGFQQVDTVSMMAPVSKAAFQPESPEDLCVVMEEAIAISIAGRPGPVVVDLPMNVQRGTVKGPLRPRARVASANPAIDPKTIEEAARLISEASRPVIFAGNGVLLSGAVEELRRLSYGRNIPVVMSLLSLGAMPSGSPLSLGFIGHTGNQYAGCAVHNADLLLIVGARLDVRQTGTLTDRFMKEGKVVRIDLDTSELDHPRVGAHINIHADAREALTAILKALEPRPIKDLSAWIERIEGWKREFPLAYERSSRVLKPQQVIETVSRLTSGRKAIVTSGVGSHQQWAARHFDFDFPERVWLTSAGHGAMGYDLPSAIGAQLANPDALVICFAGDGSIQMNIQELQTIVDYSTPVKIFVLDNSRLALVSQFQLFNWKTDPTTGNKKNPDFAAIAKAYGIRSFTVRRPRDLEATAKAALDHKGPALVNCIVDYKEDISPMLLAGQTIDRMWPYAK
ncbi:MAG: thiamine pyrophosphate-binding protein [Deltaproteobacteria bacterium]|nr:thiamine pyrophosphate-binding protein [Deltaproteobacteria bacterium]